MKKITLLILLTGLVGNLLAQTPDIMEKRARDMHAAITKNDKEQWKKFITENYSQTLIDKPMRASVESNENGKTTSSTSEQPKGTNNVDSKAKMFAQLNDDFGDSKITSLKVEGETVKMQIQSLSGMAGIVTLKYSKVKPYLIDGLGIEVGN